MKTVKTLKRLMVAGGVAGAVLAVILALTIHTAFAQPVGEPVPAGPQVTQVNSIPREVNTSINSGVKWRPAVGAAAEPEVRA